MRWKRSALAKKTNEGQKRKKKRKEKKSQDVKF